MDTLKARPGIARARSSPARHSSWFLWPEHDEMSRTTTSQVDRHRRLQTRELIAARPDLQIIARTVHLPNAN